MAQKKAAGSRRDYILSFLSAAFPPVALSRPDQKVAIVVGRFL